MRRVGAEISHSPCRKAGSAACPLHPDKSSLELQRNHTSAVLGVKLRASRTGPCLHCLRRDEDCDSSDRLRQSLAIALAAGRLGQRRQSHDPPRTRVVRQVALQHAADLHPTGAILAQLYVANEARLLPLSEQPHGGILNAIDAAQRGFDLAQLDTKTAQFDLIVAATEVLEGILGHAANPVARAVETPALP